MSLSLFAAPRYLSEKAAVVFLDFVVMLTVYYIKMIFEVHLVRLSHGKFI